MDILEFHMGALKLSQVQVTVFLVIKNGLQMDSAADKCKSIQIMKGVQWWIGCLSRKMKYRRTAVRRWGVMMSECLTLWKGKAISCLIVLVLGWGLGCLALEVISSALMSAVRTMQLEFRLLWLEQPFIMTKWVGIDLQTLMQGVSVLITGCCMLCLNAGDERITILSKKSKRWCHLDLQWLLPGYLLANVSWGVWRGTAGSRMGSNSNSTITSLSSFSISV